MSTETVHKELPVLKESSFGLKYEPAVLEMSNYEQMKQVIEGIAEKYTKQIVTIETKSEALKTRNELIDYEKTIENERKSVKRIYNEPLQAYEEKMKELHNTIKKPLEDIRRGIAEVEEDERSERGYILNQYIEERLEGTGIQLEFIPEWLNKGNFNKSGVGNKLKEEIDRHIEKEEKEMKQREANVQVITTFCDNLKLDSAPWVRMLEFKNTTDIMQEIQDVEKAKKERLERAEREAIELAEQEERNKQLLEESVQEPKEEVVEEIPEVPVETITNVIQVTGTIAQLQALNHWLVTSGIEVSAYEEERFTEDDLTWE